MIVDALLLCAKLELTLLAITVYWLYAQPSDAVRVRVVKS